MKPLFRALVVLLACAYLCSCCSLDCRNRNPKREDGSVFDPQGFPPASRRALSKSSAKSELSASNKLETIVAPPTFVAQIASAGGGTQTRRVRQRDHERAGRSRREVGRGSIKLEHEPALRIYGRRTRIVQPLQSACAMPAPKGTNRPLESIAETQPQLQSALLRLSAMISQYLTGG